MKLAMTLFLFFGSVASCAASPEGPLLADGIGGYWTNFVKWWSERLGTQSGVVMTAMAVGAASLFIITRGKWHK